MHKDQPAILLIGAACDCPDLEYASGFRAVDPVVFLRKGKEQHIVVPAMEEGRARQAARKTTVWTPRSLTTGTRGVTGGPAAWAAKLTANLGLRRVTVPASFPLGAARRLEKGGVRVVVCRTALFPERAVKSGQECRCIREVQQAAVIAMRGAIAAIRESTIGRDGLLRRKRELLTSEVVRGIINRVLLDHNCACENTIVAGGLRSADPHEVGAGPLRAQAPIVIDIFPRHLTHGYHGDLTRTVVRGHPPTELRAIYSAVKAAQGTALDRIRPGVKCSTVHRSTVAEFEKRGYEHRMEEGRGVGFIHSTGHGVGLAVHEAPSLGSSETRLRAGHVVTVEPGLYYTDIGGVRIEDTVVVTHDGWRYLAPCEKKLEV